MPARREILKRLDKDDKRKVILAYRDFQVELGASPSMFGEEFQQIVDSAVEKDTKGSHEVLTLGASDVVGTILELKRYRDKPSIEEELQIMQSSFSKSVSTELYDKLFN